MKARRVRADYESACYNKRGETGNAISELEIAINYAEKIHNMIERCRKEEAEK